MRKKCSISPCEHNNWTVCGLQPVQQICWTGNAPRRYCVHVYVAMDNHHVITMDNYQVLTMGG